MRGLVLLIALIAGASGAEASAARECSAEDRARILEPATPERKSVRLTCSLTLRDGERVTKQVRIIGARANGLRLTCRGGAIGIAGSASLHQRGDIIVIRSQKRDNQPWSRPEDVVIDGCEVNGAIRIFGLGPNGQAERVRVSSAKKNHTRRAQNAAPTRITLSNLTVRAEDRVPVYFAPGVTHSKFINSRIVGSSVSSGLYLDAESAHNTIRGNFFDVRTPREVLSIDGSANNVVADNRFYRSDMGGVFVYRNCGEGGAARHQKPMFNRITGNRFHYAGGLLSRPTIWLSFKNLGRIIVNCPQDRAIPYGSGADDRNFADENTVSHNVFVASPMSEVIRDSGRANRVFENRRVPK